MAEVEWREVAHYAASMVTAQDLLNFACDVAEDQYPLGYDPSWLRARMHPETKMMLLLDLHHEHAHALNMHDLLGPLKVITDFHFDKGACPMAVERRNG